MHVYKVQYGHNNNKLLNNSLGHITKEKLAYIWVGSSQTRLVNL